MKSQTESLFWQIFNAENEDALHKIVTTDILLKNENNWVPYGSRNREDTGNFGTFENQQPNPIPALVEKITNSVDTLLLKECRSRGIDPKSEDAPRSMQEAVGTFFGIKNGDFSEIGERGRRDIAENIQIISTGDRESPNLLIYDNGEGQRPDDFADTFLSLHKKNKTDIPFVQGKYNMGSTGAVVFCGQHRYQLIASKISEALNKSDEKTEFGFTLVRRHPLTEEQEEKFGSSWYEYFVVDDEIPRFPISEIDLGLYERNFKTGSIVKLYSYQLPRGSRSIITLDLWRDLNQYLYDSALPILLFENRDFKGHSPSKILSGNKTRITVDDRDMKEITKTFKIETTKIGAVDIEVTVFNHDVENKEFVKNKAVVFTLNGQVQGFLTRTFISKQLGFAMLKNSILVRVECSKIRTSFRQDLFMANRHNLKESDSLQHLLDKLIEELKADPDLKQLNQNRKNRILRENKADEDLLKSLLKIVPMDNDLLRLLKKEGNLDFLKNNSRTDNPTNGRNSHKELSPQISKRFPSIFNLKLKENDDGKKIKSIPLNGKGILEFETDVEDEYLFRPREKGEFQIQILGIGSNETDGGTKPPKPKVVEDVFDVSIAGPTNNSIRLTFQPKENLAVGDEIELNARLSSPDGDLQSIFYVKIVNPQNLKEQPKQKEEAPPSLPKPIRVFEKPENADEASWEEYKFTGSDIVKIIPADTDNEEFVVEAIAINMDSFVLKKYLSKNRISSEQQIKYTQNSFFTSIYLHSLFLFGIFDKLSKNQDEDVEFNFDDIEELIPSLMQSYSSFLLYMNSDAAILSSLKED